MSFGSILLCLNLILHFKIFDLFIIFIPELLQQLRIL